VTDVHGPDCCLRFGGAPNIEVLPLAVGGGGNAALSFAALSYVDSLAVTITADPAAMPDQDSVAAALQAELDALTGGVGMRTRTSPRAVWTRGEVPSTGRRRPRGEGAQARSNRSAFITLTQAATKSLTNFSSPSPLP
jgi:hypothetical protein